MLFNTLNYVYLIIRLLLNPGMLFNQDKNVNCFRFTKEVLTHMC